MGWFDNAVKKGTKMIIDPYMQSKNTENLQNIPGRFNELRKKGLQKEKEKGENFFYLEEQKDTYQGNIYDNPTPQMEDWVSTDITNNNGHKLEEFKHYKDENGKDVLKYNAMLSGNKGAQGNVNATFINGELQPEHKLEYK